MKMTSCYIYLDDAVTLIQAAGMQVGQAVPTRDVIEISQDTEDFNKHVSAMLMAIVSEMVEVGMMTEERLQEGLMKKLAEVDRYHTENKDAVLKSLEGTGAQEILPRLYPSDEEEDE